MMFALFIRLVKAIQVNQLDHDQQEVVLVFVNVNQQHLHVVDQVLVAVVPVQVFGDFIPKILQVLKLDRCQCLSWVWSLLPVYSCYTYGENILNKMLHFWIFYFLLVYVKISICICLIFRWEKKKFIIKISMYLLHVHFVMDI